MPVDPEGGGSWIAANDAGMVFALLNVTRDPHDHGAMSRSPTSAQRSRGAVVRTVAGAATVDEARTALQSISTAEYRPFRLLAWSVADVVEAVSSGSTLAVAHGALHAPMLRTSSTLGDARVSGLRQALFERLLSQPLTPAAQDAFHRHSWPDRPESSVLMSRPDARTVSITTIEVYRDRVEIDYQDIDTPVSSRRTLRTAVPIVPAAPEELVSA